MSVSELKKEFLQIYPLISENSYLEMMPEGPLLDIGFEDGHSLAFFSSVQDPRNNTEISELRKIWNPRKVWGIALKESNNFIANKGEMEIDPDKIVIGDFMEEYNRFPQNHFAIVFLSKVIQFYDWHKAYEMLKKASALLKPGGLIFVRVYSLSQPSIQDWIGSGNEKKYQHNSDSPRPLKGRFFTHFSEDYQYDGFRFYQEGELSIMFRSLSLEIIDETTTTIPSIDQKGQQKTGYYFDGLAMRK